MHKQTNTRTHIHTRIYIHLHTYSHTRIIRFTYIYYLLLSYTCYCINQTFIYGERLMLVMWRQGRRNGVKCATKLSPVCAVAAWPLVWMAADKWRPMTSSLLHSYWPYHTLPTTMRWLVRICVCVYLCHIDLAFAGNTMWLVRDDPDVPGK